MILYVSRASASFHFKVINYEQTLPNFKSHHFCYLGRPQIWTQDIFRLKNSITLRSLINSFEPSVQSTPSKFIFLLLQFVEIIFKQQDWCENLKKDNVGKIPESLIHTEDSQYAIAFWWCIATNEKLSFLGAYSAATRIVWVLQPERPHISHTIQPEPLSNHLFHL